jgi:hypothetical protein
METSPALLCRQLRQLQLQLCQLLLMPVPVIHARMVALAFRMIKDIDATAQPIQLDQTADKFLNVLPNRAPPTPTVS